MASYDVTNKTEKQLLEKKQQMEAWIESFKPQARTMTLAKMNEKLKENEEIIKYLDEEIAEYEHEIEGARIYIAEGYGDEDDERELEIMEHRLPELEEELKECQNEVIDLQIAMTQRGKYVIACKLIDKIDNRLDYFERKHAKAKRIRFETKLIRDDVPRNNLCPYCFEELDYDSGEVQLDHIHPVGKNGEAKVENLVYTCRTCNLKKKDKKLKTFIRDNKLNRELIIVYLTLLGKEID